LHPQASTPSRDEQAWDIRARNLAADAKKAGEAALAHEGLWAGLAESRQIARFSNWLLAFQGAEETDLLRAANQYMQDIQLDAEAAWKETCEQYARTLSPLGRWRSKRNQPTPDDQHWQFRLILLQLFLVVTLLVGAVFSLVSSTGDRVVAERVEASPPHASSLSSELRETEDSEENPTK